MEWPEVIRDTDQLEKILAVPSPELVEFMRRLEGDIMILGVAGKIGMSLAHQAVEAIRAAGVDKRVVGVARFSDPAAKKQLETWGVQTVVCDLMDRAAVAALPKVRNVISWRAASSGRAAARSGHGR